MIAIDKPQVDATNIYTECVSSISNTALCSAFNSHNDFIKTMANTYNTKAINKELFHFLPDHTDNTFVEFPDIRKEDWISLYSNQLLPKSKNARKFYDKIRMSASICPYCGFGHTSELDHYLPKTIFPLFSILPINLIPSCKDCNKEKSNRIATSAEEQVMHPYYDEDFFTTEQWLYAEVEETNPILIKYIVNPPDHWSDIPKARVKAHFENYNLSSRFPTEAAKDLAHLKMKLSKNIRIPEDTRSLLTEEAEAAFHISKNSWKTAMYQALANSDWYCRTGFSQN